MSPGVTRTTSRSQEAQLRAPTAVETRAGTPEIMCRVSPQSGYDQFHDQRLDCTWPLIAAWHRCAASAFDNKYEPGCGHESVCSTTRRTAWHNGARDGLAQTHVLPMGERPVVPEPPYRQLLRELYGRTDHELGFPPTSPTTATATTTHSPRSRHAWPARGAWMGR